jgi:hypothetical protein
MQLENTVALILLLYLTLPSSRLIRSSNTKHRLMKAHLWSFDLLTYDSVLIVHETRHNLELYKHVHTFQNLE